MITGSVLITAANSQVSIQIIQNLQKANPDLKIKAGLRDINLVKFPINLNTQVVYFDFEDIDSFNSALKDCQIIFLLRPPELTNVKKYILPLLKRAKDLKVQHIVFLSIQGVESNSWTPHYKIEQAILKIGIPFTFLRPAYFMQNFLNGLKEDLVLRNEIFLPAGKVKFTLLDIRDLGEIGEKCILDSTRFMNLSLDITSEDLLTFGEMASILSQVLNREIKYNSPNLIQFWLRKRKEKVPSLLIGVMILLHYLPRFSSIPKISKNVLKITQHPPIDFKKFCEDSKVELNHLR